MQTGGGARDTPTKQNNIFFCLFSALRPFFAFLAIFTKKKHAQNYIFNRFGEQFFLAGDSPRGTIWPNLRQGFLKGGGGHWKEGGGEVIGFSLV